MNLHQNNLPLPFYSGVSHQSFPGRIAQLDQNTDGNPSSQHQDSFILQLHHHQQQQQQAQQHDCGTSAGQGTVDEQITGEKMRNKIPSDPDPNKCRFCPKKFDTPAKMAEHVPYCVSVRGHACQTCGKRFKSRAGLDQHVKIHSQKRAYQCSYCHKSFIQKGHVIQHERIHTGEKPYSCAFCGRGFRQRSGQQQHEMTHLK